MLLQRCPKTFREGGEEPVLITLFAPLTKKFLPPIPPSQCASDSISSYFHTLHHLCNSELNKKHTGSYLVHLKVPLLKLWHLWHIYRDLENAFHLYERH